MVFVDAGVSSGRVGRTLIRAGAERAIVSTIVVNEGRELAVDLEITAGRANKARLNRSPVRSAREILGRCGQCCSRRRTWPWSAAIRGNDDAISTSRHDRRPTVAGVRADYERWSAAHRAVE